MEDVRFSYSIFDDYWYRGFSEPMIEGVMRLANAISYQYKDKLYILHD